jgi:hypothetical protein
MIAAIKRIGMSRLLVTLASLLLIEGWTIYFASAVYDAALNVNDTISGFRQGNLGRRDLDRLDQQIAELNVLLIYAFIGLLACTSLYVHIARRWFGMSFGGLHCALASEPLPRSANEVGESTHCLFTNQIWTTSSLDLLNAVDETHSSVGREAPSRVLPDSTCRSATGCAAS